MPVTVVGGQDAAELEPAVSAFARDPSVGLIVLPSSVTIGNRTLIISLAARHRLPAVYAYRYFVAEGGQRRFDF